MTLRAEYTLHHSDLGDFLAATVWEEENGTTLSVLSAFARLGVDPWGEAARLRALPRQAAVRDLAETLSGLPGPHPAFQETVAISDRLVGLLPKRPAAATPATLRGGLRMTERAGNWLTWLALAVLFLLLLNTGLIF